MTTQSKKIVIAGAFAFCSLAIAVLVSRPDKFYPTGARALDSSVAETPESLLPPLAQPRFDSVSDADLYLREEGKGIAIAGKAARFYPYQIISWHGPVSDIFELHPVVIRYDLGSASASVASLPEGIESQTMTWKEFREEYPQGSALSYKTGFPFDYTREFRLSD